MKVFVEEEGRQAVFRGGVWQSFDPIAAPSGGTTIDQEARTAIDSILFALQSHGIVTSTA